MERYKFELKQEVPYTIGPITVKSSTMSRSQSVAEARRRGTYFETSRKRRDLNDDDLKQMQHADVVVAAGKVIKNRFGAKDR